MIANLKFVKYTVFITIYFVLLNTFRRRMKNGSIKTNGTGTNCINGSMCAIVKLHGKLYVLGE